MNTYFVFLLIINIVHGWKWSCVNDQCIRQTNESSPYRSIEECRLVCGKAGSVWPLPNKFTKIDQLIEVDPQLISLEISSKSIEVKEFLIKNYETFIQNLMLECNGGGGGETGGETRGKTEGGIRGATKGQVSTLCVSKNQENLKIKIFVVSPNLELNLETDETYQVVSNNFDWNVTARTVYGARLALETISHLFASYPIGTNGDKALVTLKGVEIVDGPKYKYRGLLLDTARNYLEVDSIKRQIDGMAASKLNVLHWHATDSQSFPYVSQNVPNLSKFGAMTDEKIYSQQTVEDLINYAKLRGVRILMEIDTPAHAGNGWQWGPENGLGNLAVCVNQQPWRNYCIEPPCGQLNIVNPNVYTVLGQLYTDIVTQFSTQLYHMGGDEIFLPCWNSSSEIVDYLKSKGKGQSKEDFLELWGEFQRKNLELFDRAKGNTDTSFVLWTSMLTDLEVIERYLDKNRYIIQAWLPASNPLPKQLLSLGYRMIISTKDAWYLDHGFWGSTKYYTWRTVYENKIIKHKNVLGGEVCMWGEYVDSSSLDGRVWPRAAAAAERMWSDPTIKVNEATARMMRHRERLVTRGISAEALAPKYCYQNEGQCL